MMLLLGCDAGAPAPAKPEPVDELHDHTPMVVTLESTSGSCIDRWFVDFTFAIEELGVARMVYAQSSRLEVGAPLAKQFRESEQVMYFVADVSPSKPNQGLGDGCGHVHDYVGRVERVVTATSRADAQHQLAAIERDGWPATAYTFDLF
jgi:hypothetical protein